MGGSEIPLKLGKRKDHETEESGENNKRQKFDALEHHYLENMPSADMYERSYMHKDTICMSK